MVSDGEGKSLPGKQLGVEELVVLAQQGDLGAEKALFQSLAARFRVILHHQVRNHEDVEDIMQNALTAIASEYKSLKIESSFAGWAVRVLQNRLQMFYRSRQSHRKRFSDIDSNEVWLATETVSTELKSTLLECVRKICRSNSRYARILVLSFQGFQIDEVCQRLGITKNNAYSLLSRSRSLLKLCLNTGDISS